MCCRSTRQGCRLVGTENITCTLACTYLQCFIKNLVNRRRFFSCSLSHVCHSLFLSEGGISWGMVVLITHHNSRAFRSSSSTASALMQLAPPKCVAFLALSDFMVHITLIVKGFSSSVGLHKFSHDQLSL